MDILAVNDGLRQYRHWQSVVVLDHLYGHGQDVMFLDNLHGH